MICKISHIKTADHTQSISFLLLSEIKEVFVVLIICCTHQLSYMRPAVMLLCNLAPLFITMTWAYRNFYRVPSRYVELLIKSWVLWTQRGLDSPPPSFYKLSSKWQFLFKLLLIIRNLTMSRYCILLHVIYSSTSIRCFQLNHFIGFIILALSKFISNIIYHYCSLLVDRSKFDKIPSYSQKLGM